MLEFYDILDPNFDPDLVLDDYINWHHNLLTFYSLDFKIWFDMRLEDDGKSLAHLMLMKWYERKIITVDKIDFGSDECYFIVNEDWLSNIRKRI